MSSHFLLYVLMMFCYLSNQFAMEHELLVNRSSRNVSCSNVGFKLVTGVCATGLCLGTALSAVGAEILTVSYLPNNFFDDAQRSSQQLVSPGALLATTVGMGVCVLGMCVNASILKLCDWYQTTCSSQQYIDIESGEDDVKS